MKPINTSTFDFPTLIREGFVYVDKTAQIYELAKPGTEHIYFFPRPRFCPRKNLRTVHDMKCERA